MKHNHPTRDIKPLGECPGCDRYHESVINEFLAKYMKRQCSNCGQIDPGGCCFAVNYDHPSPRYTEDLNELYKVVESLGYNVYLSYSPNSKKYRARVYKFGKLWQDGKSEEKIYHKEPAMALAIALYEELNGVYKTTKNSN